MDLWQIRNQALAALGNDLKQEHEILERCFALIDECIERFYSLAESGDSNERFALICGQTLVKARRLALGCSSLILDGLSFEAGALARSLIEAWELVIYFYQKPERVELAFSEKLPKAGKIAGAINVDLHNDLKGLREHYNANSSHISFRKDTLAPVKMAYDEEQLKENMSSLFSVMLFIIFDSLPCLAFIHKHDSNLFGSVLSCKEDGLKIFGIEE